MKRLILFVSLILFSLFPVTDNHQELSYLADSIKPLSLKCPDYLSVINKINETSQTDFPDFQNTNISNSWYENAINKIRNEEYYISYNDESESFQSSNKANNIRFFYHKNGFTAKTRQTKIPLFDVNDKMLNESDKKFKIVEDWYVRIELPESPLSRNEYNSESLNYFGSKINIDKNVAYTEDDNMKVLYSNTPEGMRQDFIIKKKPAGYGLLNLIMNVSTELNMTVNNESVIFNSGSGKEMMQYAYLKAWDANQKVLNAYFEQKSPVQFAVVVDDKDAVYPLTIDPISSSPDWQKGVESWGDNLGYSVASAGDINLDGYSDVLIGAPGYNNEGQNNEGKVYLFLGSNTGLSINEAWSFECDVANARLGFSVSSAGDVNGDHYSDVIIGAPFHSNGEIKEGKVYLFYGSFFGLQPTPAWVYESNKENAQFGFSVSDAGDINNDGYGDVIIGSPWYRNSEFIYALGRVYIFLGSGSGPSADPDFIFKNLMDGYTGLGNSVSCAGDVNGDGCSDVIFSEPYWPPPSPMGSGNTLDSWGRVNVAYGSSSGTLTGWHAGGETSKSLFGYSVSSAGDINNDGYSDIIIGSPNYYDGVNTIGKCYVYHGSTEGLPIWPNWTQNGQLAIDGFGRSVSEAGDINGDGFDDVIIGAHITYWDNFAVQNENISDTTKSAAFAFYGSDDGLSENRDWHYVFYNDNDISSVHIVVSNAGDVNGDGYKDILIGILAWYDGTFVYPYDKAYVFHGGANFLPTTADWTSTCDQPMARYGYSVSGAGDVNGDGFDDVIISAPSYENGQPDEGKVFVYHGSSSGLPVTANWTAEGNFEGALFGFSVSNAGDVNNDNFSDVIIGAPHFSSGSMFGGAFVFLGSSSGLSTVHNWYFGNSDPASEFGHSVSGAGDVNGDGFDDVIVGVVNNYLYESHWIGALIFLGSSSGITPGNPAWSASLNEQTGYFGSSVSKAGDVNSDGYDDVIVGAFGYDGYHGKALVYYGSPSRPNYAPHNWESTGQRVLAFFGYSVSDAGDVNNDGIDDIIIGATEDLDYGNGKAYVYHGSAGGPVLAKVLTGIEDGSNFGESVSSAGDFNNDGFDDVVIGARFAMPYGIFVYFGSSNGIKNFPERQIPANGLAVSGAGDVNGDGLNDIIAGNILIQESVAAVYYGSGNILTSFHITPRYIAALRYFQVCFKGLLINQYNQVMPGQRVDYIIKGANPDSVSVISDSLGIAKLCYTGYSFGFDTIIGKAGNLTDKVIVKWDYSLPVKLVSFTSSVSGRDVVLSWSTASELNNYGFYIERSSEENHWFSTGFVEGNGTITETVNYTFTDKNLPTGKYSYRLKQTDYNGSIEYFELTEVVNIGIPGKFNLSQNYPNPFNPVTTINYDVAVNGIVTIKIYDILGREVKTLVNEIKSAGYYTIKFNAADLSSGTYFYKMTSGDFNAVKKFVVIK